MAVAANYCQHIRAVAWIGDVDPITQGSATSMEYRFYHFAALRVETPHRGYRRYFDNEYRRLDALASSANSPAPALTVTLHVVAQLPSEQPGDIRRSVTFKRLFRHSFLVRNLDSADVHVYFRHHPVGNIYPTAVGVFIQAQVLEPILYLKLLDQDVLLMHSAGVADDRGGYVFPAHGGTGKTTLSLNLVANGFRLLGDDLLLLEPATGHVYSYPRPLHLFSYNARTLGRAIPWSVRAKIATKNVARRVLETVTGERFLISTRVHADAIFSDVRFSAPVPFRKFKFLTKDGQNRTVRLGHARDRDEVARTIVNAADLNESLYTNILGPGPGAERVRRREVEVTSRILAAVGEIEFFNTRRLGPDEYARFATELRG